MLQGGRGDGTWLRLPRHPDGTYPESYLGLTGSELSSERGLKSDNPCRA